MDLVCIEGRVTGKVQGVWFRRFTQQQARGVSVSGFAKNLADGSVSILLCGERDSVAKVQEQIAIGPPGAAVANAEWWLSGQQGDDDGFFVE